MKIELPMTKVIYNSLIEPELQESKKKAGLMNKTYQSNQAISKTDPTAQDILLRIRKSCHELLYATYKVSYDPNVHFVPIVDGDQVLEDIKKQIDDVDNYDHLDTKQKQETKNDLLLKYNKKKSYMEGNYIITTKNWNSPPAIMAIEFNANGEVVADVDNTYTNQADICNGTVLLMNTTLEPWMFKDEKGITNYGVRMTVDRALYVKQGEPFSLHYEEPREVKVAEATSLADRLTGMVGGKKAPVPIEDKAVDRKAEMYDQF